jgi:hypothetical protein
MQDGSDNPFSAGRPVLRYASIVGIGSRIRVAAAGLVVAALAGCLSAPPDALDRDGDGDGDGDGSGGDAGDPGDGPPGSDCQPFLSDDFDDDSATRTRFAVDEMPPSSTVDISGGLGRVHASGSAEMVGYASLRTISAHEVASTALEVVLDFGSVTSGGGIIVALDTDGEESWELGVLLGRFVISHDDGSGADYLCDPCETFVEGTWRLRLQQTGNNLYFLAAPDGDPLTDLYPGGIPVVNQDLYAQIYVLAAEDGDAAIADLDAVTWSLCE